MKRDGPERVYRHILPPFIHNLGDALELADRICFIEEGRVAADGTPEEVFGMRENGFIASFAGPGVSERPYAPGAHHWS